MECENMSGSWKVTVWSARGSNPQESISPNQYGTRLSKGKAMGFLGFSLMLSAKPGNVHGCSMEFKVSLKQEDPLDLESVAFYRFGSLPSHPWRILSILDWVVCGEVGSRSPHTHDSSVKVRRAVHCVCLGPPDGNGAKGGVAMPLPTE